jgi:hypothetical protein
MGDSYSFGYKIAYPVGYWEKDRPTPTWFRFLGKGNNGKTRTAQLYFIAPSILEHLISMGLFSLSKLSIKKN